MKPARPVAACFLAVCSLFPATGALVFGVSSYQDARDWLRLGKYAATTGQVVQTDMRLSGTRSARFAPAVSYRYSVSGVEYTSSRIALAGGVESSSMGEAQTALEQLTQIPLQVWYDPASPQHAVLVRSIDHGRFIMFSGFSLLFGGLSAAIWIQGVPRLLRPRPTEADLIAAGLENRERDSAGTPA